jgi:hypothetical protein
MHCGAHNKRGGICRDAPVKGRNRCRMHGGKTPVGTACKHFRTGRYSAYVPARLRARYEQAQAGPELLSLHHEVALLDARLSDLLSRVDTGESGAVWGDLQRSRIEFARARRAQDVGRMMAAVATLETIIDGATHDHQAWGEIADLLEQRRKLVESEQKRLVSLQQMLSTEEALLLVRRIGDIVSRHVPEQKALSAILVELRQLASGDAQVPVYAEAEDADAGYSDTTK